MTYAKVGATTMNQLMHSSRIFAKKLGGKVVVDLNSIDDLYATLPSVGACTHRSARLGPATASSTTSENVK